MSLLLIDGDPFCYDACRTVWRKQVKRIDDTIYIQLNEEGQRVGIDFTQDEERKFMEESWENFQHDINRVVEDLFADEYLMAVKGQDNYRHIIYPDYKMRPNHSDYDKRKLFVPSIRTLAIMHDMAIAADGREADDLIRIWALQAKAARMDYITVSIDKDMRMIPGKLYNPRKKILEEISELEARRNYYVQLIQGDSVDRIPGVPGIGPVKAKKIFENLETEEEMQEAVLDQYIQAFGMEDWLNWLVSNAKMIHLQTHSEDYFDFSDWPIIKELL